MIAAQFAIGTCAIFFGAAGLTAVADGHTARWWRRLVLLNDRRRARARRNRVKAMLRRGPSPCEARPGCLERAEYGVLTHAGNMVPACRRCAYDIRVTRTILWLIADHLRPAGGGPR